MAVDGYSGCPEVQWFPVGQQAKIGTIDSGTVVWSAGTSRQSAAGIEYENDRRDGDMS